LPQGIKQKDDHIKPPTKALLNSREVLI